MARGIPRSLILEVPDLFSLLDSPRNRFYNSSAPRVLAKNRRDLENTELPLQEIKFIYKKKNENIRKFSAIFQDFSIFISVYQDNRSLFGIITKHSKLYNMNSMLKIFFDFLFSKNF